MKKLFGFALISILFLSGCASVNSVSLTPVPAKRGQMVQASVEKFIILGFNFDNDFVDPLVQQLKSKCSDGLVTGILTKDEVIHYFLAHKRVVTATGFCNKAAVASNKTGRRTASEVEEEN